MYTFFEKTERKIYISHTTHSHDFKSHFHGKIELTYCFSGEQKIKIGDSIYTLKGGDAAVIFPNVVHEYIKVEGDTSERTECISVISSTDFYTGILPEIMTMRPQSPVIKSRNIAGNAKLAFEKILTVKTEAELVGWTMIALSSVMEKAELIPVKETDDFKLAPSLVSYIDGNFTKPLTIKFLAKEFGYSASYIAHIFYDQLKIPFRTYLGNVRSEYAAMLIASTGKSLTEIAYECGYENLNTFCRCFKRCYGITPSEYKKELILY